MTLPKFISSQIPALYTLCEKYGVSSIFLFGSALTERFHSESDLDFLVTFEHVKEADYADNFFDFRDALSALFQRKVDLVENQTLKNPYFKKIVDNTKIPVYAGGQSAKMAS